MPPSLTSGNKQSVAPPPLIAISMGEPAGVGAEITLKCWLDRKKTALPCFYLRDDPTRLEKVIRQLELPMRVIAITHPSEAREGFHKGLPVIPLSRPVEAEFGQPSAKTADLVIESLIACIADIRAGQAQGLTTNPIQKSTLHQADFPYPGHTEFLATFDTPPIQPVMMLACETLRVVPVTIHHALADVPTVLTTSQLMATCRITAKGLAQRFGVKNPRLAVCGLNPHAGESGQFGHEEGTIIQPVIEQLMQEGLNISGPYAADSLFHQQARAQYDVAICMYHDQALIPIKTLDFYGSVNVTLGLSFIRTSPDHGTALALAGKGKANAKSLYNAIKLAGKAARFQQRHTDA